MYLRCFFRKELHEIELSIPVAIYVIIQKQQIFKNTYNLQNFANTSERL